MHSAANGDTMSRILAIDYGQKRVGLAVTDELQIIASPLETVHVSKIFAFLDDYISKEKVEAIVVGDPHTLSGQPSDAKKFIEPFVKKLRKQYPHIPVYRVDERFTSVIARETILSAGLKKKERQNKELADKISAALILQSFLDQYKNQKNHYS